MMTAGSERLEALMLDGDCDAALRLYTEARRREDWILGVRCLGVLMPWGWVRWLTDQARSQGWEPGTPGVIMGRWYDTEGRAGVPLLPAPCTCRRCGGSARALRYEDALRGVICLSPQDCA